MVPPVNGHNNARPATREPVGDGRGEKTAGCYQKVTSFVKRIGTDATSLAAILHSPQHVVFFTDFPRVGIRRAHKIVGALAGV
jgi:hypothetical protein